MAKTYIADRNPYSLTPPPDWWLRELAAVDPDLVLIPSRMRPVFWLARRRKLTADFSFRKMAGIDPTPDAAMLAEHALVSVIWLFSPSWNLSGLESLKRWLRDHDTWVDDGPMDDQKLQQALSDGGSKLTKRVDYDDEVARRRQATQQRDRIYHATGDAYRSLQVRLGRTIRNPGPATPPAAVHPHFQE